MDREAWWAAVHGDIESQTCLSGWACMQCICSTSYHSVFTLQNICQSRINCDLTRVETEVQCGKITSIKSHGKLVLRPRAIVLTFFWLKDIFRNPLKPVIFALEHVCVCVCERERLCVCVFVCARACMLSYWHLNTFFIWIQVIPRHLKSICGLCDKNSSSHEGHFSVSWQPG